ncbi:MAG: type I-U CRISPR-associated RAMP protein Csb1/Cas7u [Terricaulis sp.]
MSTLTKETIDKWADDENGPVALHLKQKLLPVEGEGAVIFPPTYADIGYNIDTLSDGTRVCTIDSVGSQANRMEPIFKREPYAAFVPQVQIEIPQKGEEPTRLSLLDLAHRGADAVVHSSPVLAPLIANAFADLRRKNDAWRMCSVAPTSLVFGVWDSRGGSGEKRPRIVRSTIRAWDVDVLSAASQFNSVWKLLDDEHKEELKKEEKAKKMKLSEKGFADAPATFRRLGASAAKNVPEFVNGSPNPGRRVLGGIYVRGRIEREVTINLVALRKLEGASAAQTQQIRRYILSLALIAGNADIDFFLRSGCLLNIGAESDVWQVVPKRGAAADFAAPTNQTLLSYAAAAVAPFKADWPPSLEYKFDIKEAKKLLAKKDEEDAEEA